jgi:hypothetical protein
MAGKEATGKTYMDFFGALFRNFYLDNAKPCVSEWGSPLAAVITVYVFF